MIVVASGDHVQTHQDVEGQREHWQIPAAVNGSQSARQNWAERRTKRKMKKTQLDDEGIGVTFEALCYNFNAIIFDPLHGFFFAKILMSSSIFLICDFFLFCLIALHLRIRHHLPHYRHENVGQQQPPVPIPSVREHSHQESHQDAVVTMQPCGYCTPGTKAKQRNHVTHISIAKTLTFS